MGGGAWLAAATLPAHARLHEFMHLSHMGHMPDGRAGGLGSGTWA